MTAAADDPLLAALGEHFGFTRFNKGQRSVIEDVLAGRPTMAVMPTGAGKSLCYQLPALLLDGVTVVVSPLIALMKDQVDSLQARGVAADYVNSSQSSAERRAALDALAAGRLDLIYVAPERFRSGVFLRALSAARVALFAVDEAHCISRWGHDFRPDYTRLGEVIERLSPPRVLACTATATAEVRDDIVEALRLAEPAVHVHGFLRSNLYLEARLCGGDKERERRLAHFLTEGPGQSGAVIVYASTRKRVERYAETVRGIVGRRQIVAYHGGMDDETRRAAQERFMSGEARVAVATNAFGMGIDRADVRAVVHVDLPRTLEGYYQEVGRAGRDGAPSHCLLLFNNIDTRVHEFLIDRSHASPRQVGTIWQRLRQLGPEGAPEGVLASVLSDELRKGLDGALRLLSSVDAVWHDSITGRVIAAPDAPDDVFALGIDFGRIDAHCQHEHAKLDRMRRFVFDPRCRHRQVLGYFGEPMDDDCPGCDRCDPRADGASPGLVFETPPAEELLIMQKALAGVARAEGRFGLRKVAGMLAGSRAKGVGDTSLVRLSTFGLLDTLGNDRCGKLLQLMVNQGLCQITGGKYPLIEITRDGWEVMQGRGDPGFRLPAELLPGAPAASRGGGSGSSKKGRARPRTVDVPTGDPVVDALRSFRTAEASQRQVPPYVVFNDRTLMAIVDARPTDEGSFLAVHGLGPGKWAAFGPRLIEALAAI